MEHRFKPGDILESNILNYKYRLLGLNMEGSDFYKYHEIYKDGTIGKVYEHGNFSEGYHLVDEEGKPVVKHDFNEGDKVKNRTTGNVYTIVKKESKSDHYSYTNKYGSSPVYSNGEFTLENYVRTEAVVVHNFREGDVVKDVVTGALYRLIKKLDGESNAYSYSVLNDDKIMPCGFFSFAHYTLASKESTMNPEQMAAINAMVKIKKVVQFAFKWGVRVLGYGSVSFLATGALPQTRDYFMKAIEWLK